MATEFKIAILVLSGVGLAFATRRSLTGFRAHGVYRLSGWIAAIALVLLNLESWFKNTFAAHQIVSWVFLLLSTIAVTYGVISLRKGRPSASRGDTSLIGPERTTILVTSGAYRYVRHPMYTSFILAAVGILLKDLSWPGAFLALITIVFAVLTAKTEERENVKYFGDAYRTYMERTSMFFPFLF
jgi:protein-S-isoprenylcysteine O-methyltransferase Ste14